MKKLLKNHSGVVIVTIILVLVLATALGGISFLTVRMVVSGDGNFLQPFEEFGWINSKGEDENDADKDNVKDAQKKTEDADKKENKKSSITKTVGSKSDYLVDDSRLSSKSKKANVDHYYGEVSLDDEMGNNEEFADLYKLMKAGINLYAQDGKTVEIELGVDISEFCKEAYNQYKEELAELKMDSFEDFQDMMMSMIEEGFDIATEDSSEYIEKYIDGGSFQVYITEKGFESLYETYDIEDENDDVEVLIDALEEAFNTKISLVKD